MRSPEKSQLEESKKHQTPKLLIDVIRYSHE